MYKSAFILWVLLNFLLGDVQAANFPGGFVEKSYSAVVRNRVSSTSFLPAGRGPFTFPAPYNTQGIRLTVPADCAGADCVQPVGYAYWAVMNNHVGSNTMYILLGLNGQGGTTLFSYDKTTDAVAKVGPLFAGGSLFAAIPTEQLYFSATQATKLYVWPPADSKLYRYDVLARTFQTVFDFNTSATIPANSYIWQAHSSSDDSVHSFTVRNKTDYSNRGCAVYKEATGQFLYYPTIRGDYDECQVDQSGRWLVIKENIDGLDGEDNRIIDLQTGVEKRLLDRAGAAGHSDNGHGYMLAADNWANSAFSTKLWDLSRTPLAGIEVYRASSWSVGGPAHISHLNSASGVPAAQQYACGSGVDTLAGARGNELMCFRLDGSYDTLIVAPIMTSLAAAGGGDSYSKYPKGNLDVTGQYFIWTSNLGGNRMDAFIAKIPSQVLMGGLDTTPPVISAVSASAITSSGATINWSTNESSDSQVEYGPTAAYGRSTSLNSTLLASHAEILSGLAAGTLHHYRVRSRDPAGNLVTSGDFTFTTQTTAPSDTTAPVISAVLASAITTSSATISWTTNEPSDTQVEYGTTTAYGNASALLPGLVGLHYQDLGFLSPSTVYKYRVKSRDAAGNLAISGNFTFTTPPLPDTNPPVITAVSVSAITPSGATIGWSTNEPADSQVEYGLTTAYGNSTTLNAALVSSHFPSLSGLASTTVYHYRVKSKDLAGNAATSGDFTFVTAAPPPPILPPDTTPPAISAVTAVAITSSGADISWGTDEPADSRVEYGLTTAYGNFVAVGTALGTSHLQNLRFLSPATGYHFRVVSRDASRNLATSGDATFTTLGIAPPPPDVTPPVISGVAPTAINTSFAIIGWTTDEASDSQVEYGPTVAYGSSTSLNSSSLTSHSEVLSVLTVATVYHYRVKSRDAAGNLAMSGDFTFTTVAVAPPDTTPPDIYAVAATSITATGATVVWATGEPADTQVEYGLTTAYEYTVALNPGLATSHSQNLRFLTADTVYHFRVKSRDAAGNLATSRDFTFKTAALSSPPAQSFTDNYTDLWWNAAESGWGVNVNHQGNILFATLFTYDTDGSDMWLVMSGGERQTDNSYVGLLYRTTGPAFNAEPWSAIPIGYYVVGAMRFSFPGPGAGVLTYSVNGNTVTKNITRIVFDKPPVCSFSETDRSLANNFQDLWWNPAESGWGINLTHQGDILFATMFTYRASGAGSYLVMSAGRKQADGSYSGELYLTTGPSFDAVPWTPISYQQVGTMTLRFSSGNAGTLSYSVNGALVTKPIVRQVFSSPTTECRASY